MRMKIFADKEGQIAIRGLCDMGLKVGGLKNLANVQLILGSITKLTKPGMEKYFKKETENKRKRVKKKE
jgi:hypothetical protein